MTQWLYTYEDNEDSSNGTIRSSTCSDWTAAIAAPPAPPVPAAGALAMATATTASCASSRAGIAPEKRAHALPFCAPAITLVPPPYQRL